MEIRDWRVLCCFVNCCFWSFWVMCLAYVVFQYIKAIKDGTGLS